MKKYIKIVKRRERVELFSKPSNRCLVEALIVKLLYMKNLFDLESILLNICIPQYTYRPKTFYPIVGEILEYLTQTFNCNSPSKQEAIFDEKSFARHGYPGCVMVLDFQLIDVRGKRMHVLTGVNSSLGMLRWFEIIDGKPRRTH